MKKKGKDRLWEFFGDRSTVAIIGFFCALYFLLDFINVPFIARLVPDFPLFFYAVLGLLLFIFQIYSWKRFRLFAGFSPKDISSIALFICEFFLLLFTCSLLSWPIYFIWRFLTQAKH